jgi:hypothetical protein
VFYRNLGGGRFQDRTREIGGTDVSGRALGVACADLDGSGRPAIALANDELPGDLLLPIPGKDRYRNAAVTSGTAYDRDGGVHGGMGTDWGDFDRDGRPDLLVATFEGEAKSLYRNDGRRGFTNLSSASGIGALTAPYVAFGCKFFDLDNDGWLDLAIANGHVQDNVDQLKDAHYRQPTQILHNLGGDPTRLEEITRQAGPDLLRPIVGRGLATGDYDNDGRVDLLVVDSEGKPLLLHNEHPSAGHWLGVRLEGTRSNRNGYGAVLVASAGGRSLTRQCQSGGSYLSASDPRVHFGLGSAGRVESLTVRWPGGERSILRDLPVDRYITIREGAKSLDR